MQIDQDFTALLTRRAIGRLRKLRSALKSQSVT